MFDDPMKKEVNYSKKLTREIERLDNEFFKISREIDRKINKIMFEYEKQIIEAKRRGEIEKEERLIKELKYKIHQLNAEKEERTKPIPSMNLKNYRMNYLEF